MTRVLLPLTGVRDTAHLTDRLAAGTEPLLHYAGLFALRPRSAERLGALVSDWLGMQVEVVEFAGSLAAASARSAHEAVGQRQMVPAGVEAAAGVRAWDPQARIILRVGPLDLQGFQRLLPDRIALHRLVSLVRAYLGYRAGVRHQSGAGRARGAGAAARRNVRSAAAPGLEHLDTRAGRWLHHPRGRGGCGVRGRGDRGTAGGLAGQGESGMSGWGGGYVTDITYMTGYYRQQSPSVIALGCLLGGVASPLPGPDDPLSYLELGCGQGFGALVLAASNPHWKVTAVDFNPAHIAAARAWAAQAGLDNVNFLEADLATLAEDPASAQVPEADFVSMHGLWSWVPRCRSRPASCACCAPR